MPIYTKTGDSGKTRLFSGEQVGKDNLRIEAYGTVDELNSCLGLARSTNSNEEIDSKLKAVQTDLFSLCSELATINHGKAPTAIGPTQTGRLEKEIDGMEAGLPKLANFIYPTGGKCASALHLSRTVCRRAERAVYRLMQEEPIDKAVLIYLNRLSDFLFVLARQANQSEAGKEEIWQK